jgi:hypothetical protein
MLIFLPYTNLAISTHFSGGGTERAEFGTLKFRGETIRKLGNRIDLQLRNGVTGFGYGGGIFNIAGLTKILDCMS